jgi:hypothetical protein
MSTYSYGSRHHARKKVALPVHVLQKKEQIDLVMVRGAIISNHMHVMSQSSSTERSHHVVQCLTMSALIYCNVCQSFDLATYYMMELHNCTAFH